MTSPRSQNPLGINIITGINKIISSMRYSPRVTILLVLFCSLLLVRGSASAQIWEIEPLLMPNGSGYSEILPDFSLEASKHHHSGYVNILLFPVTLASNAETITEQERRQLVISAENLSQELEAICQQVALSFMTCQVEVVPIFTRQDALNNQNLKYFDNDLSAIFIPDGNPDIAMQIIGGTLIEGALVRAYQQNVVIGGTGGGGSLLSAVMLKGFNPGFGPSSALHFNAVSVWGNAEQHGFLFGIQDAILDTYFFQDGNIARLLNAISTPGTPHIGVGVDSGSGASTPLGNHIESVYGRTGVMVLDSATYHSYDSVRYLGCGDTGTAILPCTPILSLRNVLVHMLAPGDFQYDFASKEHSLEAPPPQIERTFSSIQLPRGAGTLILSGGIGPVPDTNLVLKRFVEVSGGAEGDFLIVTAGYPTEVEAQAVSQRLAAAMGVFADSLNITKDNPVADLAGTYDGILVTSNDPSQISPELLSPIIDQWKQGTTLLLDDAAATLAGEKYASKSPPPGGQAYQDISASRSFLLGNVTIANGLRLLPVQIETQLMDSNRWGRFFSLAYNAPKLMVLGLSLDSGIEVNAEKALVLGDNALITLDFGEANLAQGENQAFVFANGLIDVFAPGETITAQTASTELSPVEMPTPVLITATSTPYPTATSTPTLTSTPTPTRTHRPTRTPRPTATPLTQPPPSNPNMNQWMIAFGMMIIIVIIFGLLLNRRRLR
jgi:cyanophycinase-like exopeptidase